MPSPDGAISECHYETCTMFASVSRALGLIFDPAFLGILLKALGLTLLLFAALLILGEYALSFLPVLGSPAINAALKVLAPLLLVFGGAVLGPPVTAIFACLFLDGLAAHIEARDYPDKAARPSFARTLRAGLRFAGLVLGANLVLLPFEFALPGAGELLSLLVNGWLLGREYFELAALRHLDLSEADSLRRRNSGTIWASGSLIALASMVPVLDLVAPLFGTALMVHLFHQVAGSKSG
jgi:CysZ protein